MKNRMRGVLAATVWLVAGCGQDYNSNSGDAIYSKANATPQGSEMFQQAFTILRDRCMNCHRGTHAYWRQFLTEDGWKASSFVKAGDPNGSSLITKLVNAGGNMPLEDKPLSAQEYGVLVQWVRDMK